MDEQQQEEILTAIAEKARVAVVRAASTAIDMVWNDLMPYALDDTLANASHLANEMVRKLISGNFTFENNQAVVLMGDDLNVIINIKMNCSQYDGLRKSLLEVMPECPKDLEIANLKQQLKDAYERSY